MGGLILKASRGRILALFLPLLLFSLFSGGEPAFAKNSRVEELLDQFQGGDLPARLNAAGQLAEIKDPMTVRTMVGALRDKDVTIRRAAVYVLGAIGDDRAIEALCQALADRQVAVADAAYKAVFSFGPKAKPNLLKMLKNRSQKATWRAARLLAELRNPAGMEQLLEAAKLGSPGEQLEALNSIALFNDRRALEPMGLMLGTNDPALLKKAQKGLTKWHGLDSSIEVGLAKLARQKNTWSLTVNILPFLGQFRDPTVEAFLVESVSHTEAKVRTAALESLGRMGEAHLPLLVKTLESDPEPQVRMTAVWALGQTRAQGAAAPLIRFLRVFPDESAAYVVRALSAIGEPAAPQVRPFLADPDPRLRAVGVRVLGAIHDRESLPAILTAAGEKDRRVRAAAIEALGIMEDGRACPVLIGILGGPDEGLAEMAGESLVHIGSSAVRPLIASQGVPGSLNKDRVADILSQIGEPAIGPLTEAWRSGKGPGRLVAVGALGRIGTEDSRPILEEALMSTGNPPLRAEAARWLGGIGEGAIPALIKALGDADAQVRATAAGSLGAIGDRRAVEPLAAASLRESGETRLSFMEALAKLGGEPAVDSLIAALGASEPSVRSQAASWLGRMDDKKATHPLIGLLRDPEPDVRRSAIEALANLGDEAASGPMLELVATGDPASRRAALEALEHVGNLQAVGPLVKLLADPNLPLRRQALSSLAVIIQEHKGKEAPLSEDEIGILIKFLDSPDGQVVIRASDTLRAAGKKAVPLLLDAARTGSPQMRTEATSILGLIGDKRAVPLLLSHLQAGPNPARQVIIIRALGKIGDTRSVSTLVRLLRSKDSSLRASAAEALGLIGDNKAVGGLMALLYDPVITVVEKTRKALVRLTGDRCPLLTVVSPFPYSEEMLPVLMIFLLLLPYLRRWIPPFERLIKKGSGILSASAWERVQLSISSVLGVFALALFSYSIWCQLTNPGLDAVETQFLPNLFLFALKTFPYFVGGCLISGLVMKYMNKRWLLPRTMAGACAVGAVLPLCSCGVTPLARAMLSMDIPKRTVIAFLVVTPVLNPFVLVLSYGVIGFQYTFLRIFGTFLVAILMGLIVERFVGKEETPDVKNVCGFCKSCVSKDTPQSDSGLINGWKLMVMLHRYIIIGILMGAAMSTYIPMSWVTKYLSSDILGLALAVVIGVPLYLCTGEEVILLKPLMDLGLPLGHAIAFTIAANGICITSVAVLIGVIGKRTTAWVTALFAILPFGLGYLINAFF